MKYKLTWEQQQAFLYIIKGLIKTVGVLSLLLLIAIYFTGCAGSKEVIINDICSEDSPAIVLPDEVVCNHAPANNIEVVGRRITYMCTKIGGPNED